MDDQNKKYDDFFQNRANGEDNNPREEDNTASAAEGSESPGKTSYYYSYGPFKSSAQEDIGASVPSRSNPQDSYAAASGDGEPGLDQQQSVEVTPPAPLRPFTYNQQSAKGGWQSREPRKKNPIKGMFVSFLAGVVVVGGLMGGLMYASDTNNWFTSNSVFSSKQADGGTNAGSGTTAEGSASGNGGASVAAARPDNIAQLFEKASPAVVKIETYVKPASRGGSSGSGSILDDPFFRQFFGEEAPDANQQQPNNNGDDSSLQASGIGTGFFFESDGYILTNQHVVADSDKIEVTVQGYDKPFTAELLGSSFDLDLAVLKVTGDKAFPTLPLGSSDNINIGDWVVAIGNPYGFDHTVTVGVLSAKERPIDIQDTDGTREYKHLLQTDASINPGNSGGPLLNVNGEVVGINTAVSSQAQGIGFAIPTSTIKEVLDTLKNNKEVPKEPVPFIGAELGDVTDAIAKQLGMNKAQGSIVSNVYYNSPAYIADLKQFDVILGIDGKTYSNTQALIDEIQKRKVGDKAVLNIVRRGEKMDLQVEIGDRNKFNAE
ncbi:trypsin-like peptidase domain-containing protein [Paenibacillus glycanilyticus]|uniref:S1C family serine protease n=1 Tax=Paenibacillus glycanilyticus TaxID=126569 RepID=UPI00203DA043|nr:trypsin-like peptidase domain-containing protein [Paenibacillus glycanilyticus]MCM3629214.1 trypsin-like peptidase domain-containing protein [Paenibacillus glycanilyticus]